MDKVYCICDVGFRHCDEQLEIPISKLFRYERERYESLRPLPETRKLLRDLTCSPEFSLNERIKIPSDNKIYLSVYMKISSTEETPYLTRIRQYIITHSFHFETIKNTEEFDSGEMENEQRILRLNKLESFYNKLREAHSRVGYNANVEVQHESLIPILRPYQVASVKWMIHRETSPEFFPTEYVLAVSEQCPEQTFFLNPRTFDLTIEPPKNTLLPSGGILADEMGLGKTVEILSLILCNSKNNDDSGKDETIISLYNQLIHEVSSNYDFKISDGIIKLKEFSKKIFCICNSKKSKKFEKLIICKKCQRYQHVNCVLANAIEQPKIHICPSCFNNEDLVESGATIIVTPVAIQMQWKSEIEKHLKMQNKKVLIYNGVINTGWISPYDMAKYDIVLTNYNVLKAEIHFAETNTKEAALRYKRTYMSVVSPLKFIKWWRVCLDEAQMVESTVGNAARMTKKLAAVHRWAVSGTPVEKNINNLYGLVYFLNYEPYSDPNIWRKFSNAYQNGNVEPLVNIMKKIMWRTCKSNVLDQINIPSQTEIVHYVTMSDLQSFYYQSEHHSSSINFNQKINRMKQNISVQGMTRETLKFVLEPLRKLRQDCIIPSILVQQKTVKKTLAPIELYEHLATNAEIDCKSKLRSVISSLNGIAALYLIKEDITNAMKYYKIVLRWAKDYKGNICVDSLLQIHALYNLIDVMISSETPPKTEDRITEIQKLEEIKDLQQNLSELEDKYLKPQKDILLSALSELDTSICGVNEFADCGNNDDWWRDILHSKEDAASFKAYFEKMRIEITSLNISPPEVFISPRTVDFTLTLWLDKVKRDHNSIQSEFSKLDTFITHVKPDHIVSSDDMKIIQDLVKSALECHLNKTAGEKIDRTLCQLCVLKDKLGSFECLIFDRVMNAVTNVLHGTWNPSYQENILRYLQNYVRRGNDRILKKMAHKHLQWLEGIQNQLKIYNKVWMETNHLAAVYDELNMCKSRLCAYDPEFEEESRLKISKNDTDSTMADLLAQKTIDEKEFIRTSGTVKYLKHLQNEKESVICPICTIEQQQKYAVLECGHVMCLICLTVMQKRRKLHFDCAVCRYRQSTESIYYVTPVSTQETGNQIIGSYSSKIDEIIRMVLNLVQEDSKVKIIIFSQWENILMVISKALAENAVKYRMKSAKFHISINEFKDDPEITCLLLPLLCGSKGLNLIEATHVFLVEPILNIDEELQAIGRVHRIGQTKATFIHKFIVKSTIEENIHNAMSKDEADKWKLENMTIDNLKALFSISDENSKSILNH